MLMQFNIAAEMLHLLALSVSSKYSSSLGSNSSLLTASHSLLSPGPCDNAVGVSRLPLQAVAHPPDCPAQHLNILRVLAFAANHTAHLDVMPCTHLQTHVLSSEREIFTTHSDSRGMEE